MEDHGLHLIDHIAGSMMVVVVVKPCRYIIAQSSDSSSEEATIHDPRGQDEPQGEHSGHRKLVGSNNDCSRGVLYGWGHRIVA